jgi:hypothetical protein
MKYFRICESLNLKEVGLYPQSIDSNISVEKQKEQFRGNRMGDLNDFFSRKIYKEIYIANPIIRTKAKMTDLISSVTISLHLIVSLDFGKYLKSLNSDDFEFLNLGVLRLGKLVDYTLIHPYKFCNDFIDFENSVIWRVGSGGKKMQIETVSSSAAFHALKKSLVLPERLLIDKISLQKNMPKDFFALLQVNGGIGFFVSEKIKTEIENECFSGIRFEEL